ncbi:MAG: hypothetical protein O3A08_13415 [Proteobacteria bacterium]|nr:hypothetical protein [Pseudomonadota bacterium]MDA1287388.1 hypothetical protein [Pseudomonadota bacterium]
MRDKLTAQSGINQGWLSGKPQNAVVWRAGFKFDQRVNQNGIKPNQSGATTGRTDHI